MDVDHSLAEAPESSLVVGSSLILEEGKDTSHLTVLKALFKD